jgi:hypothetical protein
MSTRAAHKMAVVASTAPRPRLRTTARNFICARVCFANTRGDHPVNAVCLSTQRWLPLANAVLNGEHNTPVLTMPTRRRLSSGAVLVT